MSICVTYSSLSYLYVVFSAVKVITNAYPNLKVLTSEIHPVAPNHFGQKYFGTD